MRVIQLLPLALLGLTDAFAVIRDAAWHPITQVPQFFNLEINDKCGEGHEKTDPYDCPLNDYAIRLEKSIVIATPYKKWKEPKLATFFVDDDTQLYTINKNPLQIYVNAVTGAVRYTEVGWLPPGAISTSFYHTGNNPLQLVDPSPSYLTWPSTMGISFNGEWAFCPLGETGRYQLFVNDQNFAPQGVDRDQCIYKALAAINANPWKSASAGPEPTSW